MVGPLEIFVIVAIIIIVFVVARLLRYNRGKKPGAGPSGSAATRPKKSNLRGFGRKTGIILVISGIILAFAGMSMFRWAVQGYLWAFIFLAAGLVFVYLSRKE